MLTILSPSLLIYHHTKDFGVVVYYEKVKFYKMDTDKLKEDI